MVTSVTSRANSARVSGGRFSLTRRAWLAARPVRPGCSGNWDDYFEPGSADTSLDIPERRQWGPKQRAFFGIEQPYQMADDEGPFTYSCVWVEIADPYHTPGELIAGIVHGVRERCAFTCPCHSPDVVYTTRHRLVCMSCGATHLVLREPVLTAFRQTIAPEEWGELFGDEGSLHHERSTCPSSMFRTSRMQRRSSGQRTSGTRLSSCTSCALARRLRSSSERFVGPSLMPRSFWRTGGLPWRNPRPRPPRSWTIR